MIDKNIDDIASQDLQNLISDAIAEWKTIEYKQELPDDSKQSKKEFLADVSSFANASGGDIIFGISSKQGIPKGIGGIPLDNEDQAILRMESIIRDGIEPRIMIHTKVIAIGDSRCVIVIRVPKSWNSPHRVKYDGHNRFYSRSSNGKYELDVSELRTAFNLTQTIIDKIKDFRFDRISKIQNNDTPVLFVEGAKVILNLIPIASFNPNQNYDIDKIASHNGSFWPIGSNGCITRYNLDGFLSYSRDSTANLANGYAQLYRNGIVEAVDGLILKHYSAELYIPNIQLEEELIKSLEHYLSVYKTLEIEPPVFVFLTFTGVKGYHMPRSTRYHSLETYPIERDILIVPEVMIDNYAINAPSLLKPLFDALWNACGFSRSLNYDENGNWCPRR